MNAVVADAIDFRAQAHRDPWSIPLDEIDVSNPYVYSEDTLQGFFARLRRDAPVHFTDSPMYGPYWSVTRYRDIMAVDTSHQTYSSDAAFGDQFHGAVDRDADGSGFLVDVVVGAEFFFFVETNLVELAALVGFELWSREILL